MPSDLLGVEFVVVYDVSTEISDKEDIIVFRKYRTVRVRA